MSHLWRNRVVDLHQQNVWKTPLKNDIFSKEAGHWPVSLLKMSPFGRCISNILPVRISFLPSFSVSCKLGVNGLKKLLSQIYWNIENILNTLKYIEMRHLSIKTSPLQFLLQINPLETFVLGRFLSSYILFNWVKIRTSWGASHPSALMNNCLN